VPLGAGYKPRRGDENADRTLKLNCGKIFSSRWWTRSPRPDAGEHAAGAVPRADAGAEKLLRPKGRSAGGEKNLYEHAKTKQMYECLSAN